MTQHRDTRASNSARKARDPNPAGVSAVVLGGHVNGYGIVRSLHEAGVRQITVIDTRRSAATYSRLISRHLIVRDLKDLPEVLLRLADQTGRLVLYPTSDDHIEALMGRWDDLAAKCFLPFNPHTVHRALSKSEQYAAATAVGIDCPRTVAIRRPAELASLQKMRYPVLVKPSRRVDLAGAGFRNLVLTSPATLDSVEPDLLAILSAGAEVLASEIIPGDDGAVYAYTAYRSPGGDILRGWTGRKLAQYPDAYGVYSSASSVTYPELESHGRRLIEALDCHGICEPEFKLDPRDGRLKLMEVNLRSMMWHRVGALAGVNLPEAQWLDAQSRSVPQQHQSEEPIVHTYLGHEVGNLLARPNYWTRFWQNLRYGRREWAFWNPADPVPFVASLKHLPRMVLTACQRRFAQS